MISLGHFLVLAALLFCIGLYGALTKRNAVAVLMSFELMLNAVNINLVAFSRYITPVANPDYIAGQIFAVFTIIVAAAEVAVGLAIVISICSDRLSVELDDFDWLKW